MNSITKLCSIYGIGNHTPITKNARALAKRIKWNPMVHDDGLIERTIASFPQKTPHIPDLKNFTLETPSPMSLTGGLQLWKSAEEPIISTTYSTLPKDIRGFGIGRKMYGKAIRDAYMDYKNKGGHQYVTSDTWGVTSPSAEKVWKSLLKRGYPVEENSSGVTGWQWPELDSSAKFKIDLNKMHNFYKDVMPKTQTFTTA